MIRNIEIETLLHWKSSPNRRPLLVRGARQVGKTYSIRQFSSHFENLVEINFELQPDLKKIFSTLEPNEILKNIRLLLNQRIEPGKTLLFLDEIQDCPQAILALRYFYEKLPELHVIGAGSLLEFTLGEKGFKMPVGRIQYLYLGPLSFEEFLRAAGGEGLWNSLQTISLKEPIPEPVHEKLLKNLRGYLAVGGMPAAVQRYLKDPSSPDWQTEQLVLLQTYRDDFGKYASRARHPSLQKVFSTAPAMVGKRYKYSHVDPDTPSRDLKEAFFLLCQAGVLYKVAAASAHGLPLQTREGKFKVLFLDVGLMQKSCGLDATLAMADDLLAINAGAVAEQFVGQERLASIHPFEDRRLYFWARDKRGSQAEIDYLTPHLSQIIPIEVKSGKTGRLKSLQLFMQEHGTKLGVRISQHPLSLHDRILSVPLYAAGQIPRLTEEALKA